MIKVRYMENTDGNEKDFYIVAFADTKAEVTPDAKFVGLPDGASIEFGSRLTTAEGDLAYMKSDGAWNWVE